MGGDKSFAEQKWDEARHPTQKQLKDADKADLERKLKEAKEDG